MKSKLAEDLRTLFEQSKNWVTLEIEYAKLTVAEKVTVLLTMMVIGFVCLLLGMVVLILLGFAIAEAFKLLMSPALAYLSSAGAICLLLVLIYFLRRPILLNPISKAITKVFFEKKS